MFRRWLGWWLVVLWSWAAGAGAGQRPLYVLQANDPDPTSPTSQPASRWYHWLGADPAVTHLETGLAIDAGPLAGRGQRIDVAQRAPITAVQVKIKRIGRPGALVWQAGTAWGRNDLGHGEVPADGLSPYYEHFVTLPLTDPAAGQPASQMPGEIFLCLRAASGLCPADYYAVYCTWKENHPELAHVNSYTGPHEVGMMFRALREDHQGAALEADGRAIVEGASMMTRLLTIAPAAGRRRLLDDEQEPYGFVESLAAGRDPRRAGLPWPDVRAEAGEIEVGDDWRIQVAAGRSPQVETAAADLALFLRESMRRSVAVTWDAAARPGPHTITLSQGPDLPDGPRRPAGYRFAAGGGRVQIHGWDANGVLRGVWYLEDLLALRGGPLLKPDARTREPRYTPRATCAAWGGMGELVTPAPVYTDAHLSLISHYGYDAIWLGWAPGPERDQSLPTAIAPGRVPEGTTYQPYLARLRDLVQRAERYGLEVVVQYIAPHPENQQQRLELQQQARQFVSDLPQIRTIVLLEEGMGSRLHKLEGWVDTCNLLARAFYEVRPDVQVAAWTYNFHPRTADRAEWDRRMQGVCRLDRRVAYMSNFDSFWSRRRDGLLQYAFDYGISLEVPSEDFRHAAEYLVGEARRDGRPPRTLLTKIESRFGQESNTAPEIPCMQRWLQLYRAVGDFDVLPIKGLIANWYHQGFFPTTVTELCGWSAYTAGPSDAELLAAVARRDFGPAGAPAAVEGWQKLSEAIGHFPFYYNLSYTMNAGPAQPFWLDPQAVSPRPWRRGFVNSLALMSMQATGDGPGSGPENRARLRQLQQLWQAGVEDLRRAAAAAPTWTRPRAEEHLHMAQAFADKVDVTLRLVAWLDAREQWQHAATDDGRRGALDALEQIGHAELAAAQAGLPMYVRDSRLGYLNHGRGCFTAESIRAKIAALEKTLDEELPALRQAAGKP